MMMGNSEPGRSIALYGGAFDPPHVGHTGFCCALAAEPSFSEVWVLPCYRHPFGKDLAPFDHRLAMCRIAFEPIASHIHVRDDEVRTPGEGYTIDLVRYLLREFPDLRFTLALGSDNYRHRHKWKSFDLLQTLVPVKFFGRRGFQQENEELGLATPFPEVSSTELRLALEDGLIQDEFLPGGVGDYIRVHKLYRRNPSL